MILMFSLKKIIWAQNESFEISRNPGKSGIIREFIQSIFFPPKRQFRLKMKSLKSLRIQPNYDP